MMESTALYIANLRQYNDGNILGDWFTLPVSWSSVEDYLKLDGSEEYGEEWIILDWENPYGLTIYEYSNINELNNYVTQLEDLDSNVLRNLSAILSFGNEELQDILDNGADKYMFTHESSMEDVARAFVEDMGGIQNAIGSDSIDSYIDYGKLARDMEIDGNYFQGNDGNMIEYIG